MRKMAEGKKEKKKRGLGPVRWLLIVLCAGMAAFSAYYVVELRRAGSDAHTAVEIKDNGDLHLSTADRTYRVTSKDSKRFELLREIYNKEKTK